MTNSAEQLLYRAATLLEDEQDVEGAIEAIEEAISVAEIANHPLDLVRARTMMGDLLAQAEAPEMAADQFREVIRISEVFDGDPALVDEELAYAREWLARFAADDKENN